jgi:hypothetical protein
LRSSILEMVPFALSVILPHEASWKMGSNGHMMVDGIKVEKVTTASQSKSGNVWI